MVEAAYSINGEGLGLDVDGNLIVPAGIYLGNEGGSPSLMTPGGLSGILNTSNALCRPRKFRSVGDSRSIRGYANLTNRKGWLAAGWQCWAEYFSYGRLTI